MKIVQKIRNNWKKTVFFSIVTVVGGRWVNRKREDELLRRDFCVQAAEFGRQSHPPYSRLRHVTVLLNPAAGDRSSKSLFDKNVAPLLNLGGLDVHVVKTEYEGQATGYMDVIEKGSTDAIILVGGSGLIMEAITGLLRRPDSNDIIDSIPIGLIPTGKSSCLAASLFSPLLPRPPTLGDVRFMGEAAMAILRGKTVKVDVLRVETQQQKLKTEVDTNVENNSENLSGASDEVEKKTVFAVAGLEWGMHVEVDENVEKYWYFGSYFKHKMAYIMSVLKSSWLEPVSGSIHYIAACDGCCKCISEERNRNQRKVEEELRGRSIFQKIFTAPVVSKNDEVDDDKTNVNNPECGTINQIVLEGSQLVAAVKNIQDPNCHQNTSGINLYSVPTSESRWQFVSDGLKRIKDKTKLPVEPFIPPKDPQNVLRVQEFQLLPSSSNHDYFNLDNERFEVMPLKVVLMKKCLTCFSPS